MNKNSTPLILLIVALIAGCQSAPQSNYDLVDLVLATGTITLDGNPLADAVVSFDAPDGQFSYGMTDSSGHYILQFDTVKTGVTPGPKTVKVSTARTILGLNADEDDGESPDEEVGDNGAKKIGRPEELVPEKYNRQSVLKTEVTPDQTEYNFDLTSK